MNNYVKAALLVILVVVLFMLIRALLPAVRHSLREMPKWLMIVLVAAVVVAIVLLVKSFATSGGATGSDGIAKQSEQDSEAKAVDCIIVRADEIFIDGRGVGESEIRTYAAGHDKVYIVDDYGLATRVEDVIRICEEEGAECEIEDERWLEEKQAR